MKGQAGLLQSDLHVVVVSAGDLDEFHTASLEVCDVSDDVVGQESDVLHTGTVVEVDIFFDLRLLLALGWFVDGHLDDLVWRGHHDTLQSGEFTTQLLINRLLEPIRKATHVQICLSSTDQKRWNPRAFS